MRDFSQMSSEARAQRQAIEPIPFGRYALLDRLNVGGMAEVFLAKTTGVHDVDRFVAIKRILPQVADDPEFERMFIDEAKLSVQLTHANVAQTFELGRIGPSLYIAMEYVSGVDIRQIWEHLQEGGEFPISALVYMVAKLCEGLDYAHRKTDAEGRHLGIVHRDISPQNIMVAYDGQVKVIDFGIAKAKIRASQTRVGILKGKFAYMSPEQVAGLELDARSDVFSVGIVLYELVTKSRLFKSESDFMTLERARHVELYPPRLVNPKLPRDLERILMKTLARDREERTSSAEALHEMLMRFAIQSGESCSARDLSALLQREFMKSYAVERSRLVSYLEIKVPPSNVLPEISLKSAETFASIAAVQGAQISSGETRIIGLAEGEDKTSISAEPPSGMEQVVSPKRRMVLEGSDTKNLRKGKPPPAPDPTRLLQVESVGQTQMLPAPSPPEDEPRTDRIERGKKKRAPVRFQGRAPKLPDPPAIPQKERTPSFDSRSAARLSEPRFGRESVLVWLSTAVAIVLVVLAYWLSGQLNPSAKILIDAEPKTAELFVNAKRLGPIAGRNGFEVAPGEVLVEVRASGHCPWFRNLKLTAKETFSTKVALQPRKEGAACPP